MSGEATPHPARTTDSGIPVPASAGPSDLPDLDAGRDIGEAGAPPFTRGIRAGMYRERPWTMRQYAGMGTAEETNRRFRYLLEAGQTGLSVAFDLPTQMGYDSDHPAAEGEVGRTGVAIDDLDDMRRLLDGIPLDAVSTSMTINATAPILLLLYELVAEERGIDSSALAGTVQNDILKEYAARGTYIYPPAASLRLTTDLMSYCAERIPRWNTISISGYHMREAGATAAQELAFTLADAIAYVEAARTAGLDVDAIGPRLSFFFACHQDFLEEIAKFRAARRMWARIMSERFDARDPRSLMLRFHTQTGGATLTAQQPLNNVVRTTLEALSAVLGGTQSLHTNSYDEALGLPSEEAARLALRTQQVIAEETGLVDHVDPFGGAWLIERLTCDLEAAAGAYLGRIDAMGGAVAAIEAGFYQDEIHESAFRMQQSIEAGDRVVVGVNRHVEADGAPIPVQRVDEAAIAEQIARVGSWRRRRDAASVSDALEGVRRAAASDVRLLEPMKEALGVGATLGEVSDALREVFGEHRPGV